MGNFKDLIEQLASDKNFLKRFLVNPKVCFDEYNLTEGEIDELENIQKNLLTFSEKRIMEVFDSSAEGRFVTKSGIGRRRFLFNASSVLLGLVAIGSLSSHRLAAAQPSPLDDTDWNCTDADCANDSACHDLGGAGTGDLCADYGCANGNECTDTRCLDNTCQNDRACGDEDNCHDKDCNNEDHCCGNYESCIDENCINHDSCTDVHGCHDMGCVDLEACTDISLCYNSGSCS